MRKGFSLVDALVALALFQIGMLALAATTVVAARDLGQASRRARALSFASDRVERLRLDACTSPDVSGQAGRLGGFQEYWRVRSAARRRVVSDSVVFALPTGRLDEVAARGEVLCPP